jgi:hypothetical protein
VVKVEKEICSTGGKIDVGLLEVLEHEAESEPMISLDRLVIFLPYFVLCCLSLSCIVLFCVHDCVCCLIVSFVVCDDCVLPYGCALFYHCLVLFCLVLSCAVLTCHVLSYFVLMSVFLFCLALSWRVVCCLILS